MRPFYILRNKHFILHFTLVRTRHAGPRETLSFRPASATFLLATIVELRVAEVTSGPRAIQQNSRDDVAYDILTFEQEKKALIILPVSSYDGIVPACN